MEAADFDADGFEDLVVACSDGRMEFYRGNGDGSFVSDALLDPGADLGFLFAAEALLAGDYDQDGDIDLAAVNFYGELAVIENPGDLVGEAEPNVVRMSVPFLENPELWYHVRELQAQDLNGDGDPELILGLDAGLAIYGGVAGLNFAPGFLNPGPGVQVPAVIADARFAVNGFALGDYDSDGDTDMAVSCFSDGCLTLLAREPDGLFHEAQKVKVPAAEFLTSGDLDGDGLADLVGTGRSALWVALSGSQTAQGTVPSAAFLRAKEPRLVINEVMPSNDGAPVNVPPDVLEPGKFPDWIEFYNGGEEAISLQGWQFELTDKDGDKDLFQFAEEVLGSGERVVLICSEKNGFPPYKTGFKLPAKGGVLRLLTPGGAVADEVVYPSLATDVALARYSDGSPSWLRTNMASPGGANVYTGPLAPDINFRGLDPASLGPESKVRFFARAKDDIAMAGISIVWRRTDFPDTTWARALLYDDGVHHDGEAGDRNWAGTLDEVLPPGAEIAFYLEGEDVSGAKDFVPARPEGGESDEGVTADVFYHFAMPSPEKSVGLELSEIVAINNTVWQLEDGSTPDYVEIRNTGSATISLDGLLLTDEAFKERFDGYSFPSDAALGPGEYLVVACDGGPTGRPGFAPFKIDSDREQVALARRTESGLAAVVDMVQVRKLGDDEALFRAGQAGEWWTGVPTRGLENTPAHRLEIRRTDDTNITLLMPVGFSGSAVLEATESLHGDWNEIFRASADGVERAVELPLGRQMFFRLKQIR